MESYLQNHVGLVANLSTAPDVLTVLQALQMVRWTAAVLSETKVPAPRHSMWSCLLYAVVM